MTRKKLGGFERQEYEEDVDVIQQEGSDPASSSASYSEDSTFILLTKTVLTALNEFALNLFLRRDFTFLAAAYQMIEHL